jgi:hypothetical protein
MKNSMLFLCLCLFAAGPSSSFAQVSAAREPDTGKIPAILFEGLHQLANQKPEEAEKAWFRGSPSAGQPVSGELRALLKSCGAYQGFDTVSVQDITPRLRIIYLALNFERQPTIVKFMVYRTTDGWILLERAIGIGEELFESVAPTARD